MRPEGFNGSFDNLETLSNYEEQYIFGTMGANPVAGNFRASMMNMQNLKNVRESYTKRFAE